MSTATYTLPGSGLGVSGVSPGGSAGNLELIADHCADALALLIPEYDEAVRLHALICSYLERLQEIEGATLDVWSDVLSIETAAGDQLDLVGQIVTEARNGRSDAVYRLALRVRVLINRSEGRAEELIQIVRLFESLADESGSYVRLREGPGRVIVSIVRTPINTPAAVHSRLRDARAAAIALQTVTTPVGDGSGPSRSFTLSRAADYPEGSTERGLGRTADPSHGGYLPHVLD